MKAEQTRQLDAMTGVTSHSGKTKGKKKKKGSKAFAFASEQEHPPPPDELPISISQPVGRRVVYRRIQPKEEGESGEVKGGSNELEEPGEAVSDDKAGHKRESSSEEESEGEEVSKKKEPKKKTETPEDLISDTYNGAALDDYKWSQTMTDVDVRVPVASGTKGKDVSVDIRSDHIKVVLHKPERKVTISLFLFCPFTHLCWWSLRSS